MTNVTFVKCPNPDCGTALRLNIPVALAIKKTFNCPVCKQRFAIKDALFKPEENEKSSKDSEGVNNQNITPDSDKQNQESDKYVFCSGVVLFRNDDKYPYLFFWEKTTFGRYDDTMQADVLCLTDDTTMSRRHISININSCDKGLQVSLTNLSAGICKVDKMELKMGETIELTDGMSIRLGNTDFTIRDVNKNDIKTIYWK